jgi:hypothetical protein
VVKYTSYMHHMTIQSRANIDSHQLKLVLTILSSKPVANKRFSPTTTQNRCNLMPHLTRIKEMDRMGVEPTTSAMPPFQGCSFYLLFHLSLLYIMIYKFIHYEPRQSSWHVLSKKWSATIHVKHYHVHNHELYDAALYAERTR